MTLAFVALSTVCPDSLNALGSMADAPPAAPAAAVGAVEGEEPPAVVLLIVPPVPLLTPMQLWGDPLREALVVEADGINNGLKPEKIRKIDRDLWCLHTLSAKRNTRAESILNTRVFLIFICLIKKFRAMKRFFYFPNLI